MATYDQNTNVNMSKVMNKSSSSGTTGSYAQRKSEINASRDESLDENVESSNLKESWSPSGSTMRKDQPQKSDTVKR